MATSRAEAAEKVLDSRTSMALGLALFKFLARANEESENDDFGLEDLGVDVRSGFIELPDGLSWDLGVLLEKVDEASPS